MELYIQTAQFVTSWRVRVQNDGRGQFINLYGDGSGNAYLSLDTDAAVRLLEDIRDGLLELQKMGAWDPRGPGTDFGVPLGCPDDPVGM